MDELILHKYDNLRIAIILQMKKDYISGYITDIDLRRLLRDKWIIFLLDPVAPEVVYREFRKQKERYYNGKK